MISIRCPKEAEVKRPVWPWGPDRAGTPFARRLIGESTGIRAALAANAFWSLGGSAVTQASSLLAVVLLGRILGVAGLGQLALIQNTVLVLGNLGEFGCTLSTVKFTARWRSLDPQRAGRLLGWSLRTTAISGLVMGLVLIGSEPWLRPEKHIVLSHEFRAAFLFLLFEMLNRVQFGGFSGLESFRRAAQVQVWRGLLMLPMVWLGGHYGKLMGALLAMSLVSGATFIVGHLVLRSECRQRSIPISFAGGLERGTLSTTISLWISTLLMTGSTWAITVLLSRQPSGQFQLGLFNAADKWKLVLLFLPNVLFQVILPMLSHSYSSGQYKSCSRIISIALLATTLFTSLGAVGVIVFARPFMAAFGGGFAEGANVLILAALVAVVAALASVGSGVLWAIGKPRLMLGIDLLRTILLLGLCFVAFGTTARSAMLAQVFAYGATCVVVLFFTRRELAALRIPAGEEHSYAAQLSV